MKEKFKEEWEEPEKENDTPTMPRFVLIILIVCLVAFAYLTFSGAFNSENGEPVNMPSVDTRPLDLIFMNQLNNAENQAELNGRDIHNVSGDLMQLAGNVNQIENNLDNAENKISGLETEIGSANQRISGLENDLTEARMNVRDLTNSLQTERERSTLLSSNLEQSQEKIAQMSNNLQFFMLASFVFGLMLVFSLIGFGILLFYSFVRGHGNRRRPDPNIYFSEYPQKKPITEKTTLPHRQAPHVVNTPVVISRGNRTNVTGYEPVITSYNGEMVSSGISLPLDSIRPPTPPEAQYMREMKSRGASINAICHAFYGGKNQERFNLVTAALENEY